MKLPELCIKRPVLATVLNLIIILVGVISFYRLTVREYPNIDVPVVTVETVYTGANPEIIESQITTPLEDSLSGIEGIDHITSISRSELSQITITFKLNTNPNAVVGDVRDRVGRVRDKIPDEAKEPTIMKVEADAQPIIWLAFTSDRLSPMDVTDLADRLVKDRIETLPGVANVQIFGERRYTMRLWLDPLKLAAYQITPNEIEEALRQQNLEVPSGRIESIGREFTVLSSTDLKTPEEFSNIILAKKEGYLVRVSDIAKVEIAPAEERQLARFNGKNAIALGVVKQSTANPLEVSKNLTDLLPKIHEILPPGVDIQMAYDSSIFIEHSIKAVYETMLEAIFLVILVIFLFLRSFRATFIPLVTIPVSLIGNFTLMMLFGFSINTLTLLAMVLAIGLVVDDAIVVLENIYRHLEKGEKKQEAAIEGSREITFAIISMTLTLAAVFTPIAFSTGKTGKLFIEFSISLATAVIVSGFTALTLSPMMCSKLLKKETQGESSFNHYYQRALEKTLKNRRKVLGFIGLSCALLIGLFLNFPSELAPLEDRGSFMGIGIAPEGSTLAFSDKYARQIEQIYQTIPEVERYFVAVGFPNVTRTIFFVGLQPWEDRKRTQQDIVQSIIPQFFNVAGLMAFPINPPSLGQSGLQQPIEVMLQSSGSYEDLDILANKVIQKAQASKIVTNLESDLKLNTPELTVKVDRNKIASIGSEVGIVSRAIETMIAGRQVTRFKRNNQQYDVIVQNAKPWRHSPHDLDQVYVRSKDNEMVPLSNLGSVTETVAPQELNHFNKLRAAKISGNLMPGHSLEEGLEVIEAIVKEIAPPEIQLDYSGTAREFRESKQTIYFVFGLALCFIYLVLAAQFESFIDPLIILFSVPLAITGALLTLKLTGGTLNIYTQIGLITLIGLITKHGILIVEFSNQLQEKGLSVTEAVLQASLLRLRPILMTTSAMVLGALPLAFASGAGGVARSEIGWVIVGGLSVGTFFTLFIVPTIYSYLSRTNSGINS